MAAQDSPNMNNLVVNNMRIVPCDDSRYIRPARVVFNQNGFDRTWDYIVAHDSVAALLFNKTRNAFVLVKQFRPAVYLHTNRGLNKAKDSKVKVLKDDTAIPITAPANVGVTSELCAGIVDKDIALSALMKQEVLEECGYDVPENRFEKIFHTRGNVGIAGTAQTMFYAEVDDSMIVNGAGGGNRSEGEAIELMYLPREEVMDFLVNESLPKPPSLMAAFFWYLHTKKNL